MHLFKPTTLSVSRIQKFLEGGGMMFYWKGEIPRNIFSNRENMRVTWVTSTKQKGLNLKWKWWKEKLIQARVLIENPSHTYKVFDIEREDCGKSTHCADLFDLPGALALNMYIGIFLKQINIKKRLRFFAEYTGEAVLIHFNPYQKSVPPHC